MIRQTFTLCLVGLASMAYAQPAPSNTDLPAANPDSASFYFQRGLAEKQTGRRQMSLRQFEKAASFDSTNKEIIAELATAYYELRKYPQSKECYRRLISGGDASSANYKQLVSLCYNLKQNDDVVLYASQWKKADPAASVGYFIGKVQYDQENYGEAIRQLTIAAKEDPANAEVPYMIARSYADMQNYKQSIPFFQKAIELDTTRNNWMYELGLIYYAMHADKESLRYILMAGDKGYKRDNEYLENLGIAHLNVGNLDQGVAIMQEVLKKRPSDLNILNMVAEAYYYKGKYQQAIDYWDQMLEYDKQNASALYMIGMSYQKKGEKDKGQLLCDKAIEMDPSLAAHKQKKQIIGL